MGQEFFIKSDQLEAKIRQLLPSQGGLGAGQDLSGSTTIVPIVDLTESAEGSQVREDIQKALSFNNVTSFDVASATDTVLVNSTGYFRVFGSFALAGDASAGKAVSFNLFDGATSKVIYKNELVAGVSGAVVTENFDFLVKLEAGDSLRASASDTAVLAGCTRQIADIDGNLN